MNTLDIIFACFFATTVIVSTPMAWRSNRTLQSETPEARPFMWGYYQGYSGIIAGALWIMLSIYGAANGNVNASDALMISGFGGACIALGWYTIKRNAYALVALTIISCNVVHYVINAIYIKNRWKELTQKGNEK